MLRFQRGRTAKLYSTWKVNDIMVDPTSPQVAIYHGDDVVIVATTPTKISDGYFFYEFSIPSSWTLDLYNALWTGTLDGISTAEEETFEVIKEDTLTGSDLPSDTYCTLGDVQGIMKQVDLTGPVDVDTYMTDYIYQAEEDVDEAIERTLKQVTETIYLDGTGQDYIMLPRCPIIGVADCVIRVDNSQNWLTFNNIVYINCTDVDGVVIRAASTDTEVKASDLYVDCSISLLRIPQSDLVVATGAWPMMQYSFIEGRNNIKITYTSGYTSGNFPRRIRRLASLFVVKEFLLRKGDRDSGGQVSMGVDGMSRNYGALPYEGRLAFVDAEIQKIARFYRRIGVST